MRYDIRVMSFAEILDTGFRIVRNHFMLLVPIAATSYVTLAVLAEITSWLRLAIGLAGAILSGLLFLILFTVVMPLTSAAIVVAVGEIYVGRPVTMRECMRKAWAMMLPLAGTMLLFGVVLVGAAALALVPGGLLAFAGMRRLGAGAMGIALLVTVLYVMLAFLLVWEVAVIEGRFGRAALRRSRELMRGNVLRGAGIVLIGALIVGVLTNVLALALGYIPVVGVLASGTAQAVGAAYTTALHVLLYFDIRCRKEAFDLEHLAAVVASRDAVVTGALQPAS
jgi:hypothetical protein